MVSTRDCDTNTLFRALFTSYTRMAKFYLSIEIIDCSRAFYVYSIKSAQKKMCTLLYYNKYYKGIFINGQISLLNTKHT